MDFIYNGHKMLVPTGTLYVRFTVYVVYTKAVVYVILFVG